MKKRILLLTMILFLLIGCTMGNTPTTTVENLFTKYQRFDDDIVNGINKILDEQNMTNENRSRYYKLLEKQYRNLKYEIKDEKIDGNKAIVIVEIEVIDYKKTISDLTFDSNLYTKESFDNEKLNRLEAAEDKVTYTLEFSLTKNENDMWKLDALTNEETKKIQGMY